MRHARLARFVTLHRLGGASDERLRASSKAENWGWPNDYPHGRGVGALVAIKR
jgi:hypothetical protein